MKTKITHTPGPWKLEAGRHFKTSSGTFYISYGKDDQTSMPHFPNFCELDANARLIAEAPAMLGAIKALVDDLAMWPGAKNPEFFNSMKAARAILTRIEKGNA